MDSCDRISHMEEIFDKAEAVLSSLKEALYGYESIEPQLKELEAYYCGPQWLKDTEDDSLGKFPLSLKRGVLSQDGIWNLLSERDELFSVMRELTECMETEEN